MILFFTMPKEKSGFGTKYLRPMGRNTLDVIMGSSTMTLVADLDVAILRLRKVGEIPATIGVLKNLRTKKYVGKPTWSRIF